MCLTLVVNKITDVSSYIRYNDANSQVCYTESVKINSHAGKAEHWPERGTLGIKLSKADRYVRKIQKVQMMTMVGRGTCLLSCKTVSSRLHEEQPVRTEPQTLLYFRIRDQK